MRVLDGSSKVVATLGGKTDQYGYIISCFDDFHPGSDNKANIDVHNLETGTELNPQPNSAVYASERGSAVTLNAPLSAQSNEEQPAETDPNFGQKLTLSGNNTKYLCSATNNQGVVLYSQVATLTVSEALPVTGDTSSPITWLALLVLSGLALLLLAAGRRPGRQRGE